MQDEKSTDQDDLLSKLNQATEIKKPSADTVKSWTWDDESGGNTTPDDEEHTPALPNKGNLTDEQIRSNAIASAAGISLITELLSEGIVSLRYHFKTPAEDRQLLDERLLDSPFDTLTAEEQFKVNRYHRLKKELDSKLEKITKSEKTRKRMEDAFADYSRATGKVFLTPQSRLWISISEDTIKAVMASIVM